ncbi:hypothetical protein C9374_008461 [Naegleria lovaniensis]|uniref:BTB domain-containing protein n=1 Tax=Naegleria lovaniensis TaxID=51637 RepID=A0AA88GGX2_NAELO|nr:uncharacterized protein C9374_008461 [Naegleria lovaniensis]KAG2378318.1 hypothetical protein C9374_008461 [Naegleria lovaniensis]
MKTFAFMGATRVGKTCLIHRLTKNQYCQDPLSHTIVHSLIDVLGIMTRVSLVKVMDKDLKNNRFALISDVFFLCFALDDIQTLTELEKIWIPALVNVKEETDIKIILVGTKADLLLDESIPKRNIIQKRVIVNFVEKYKSNIQGTFLTSSKTGYNVKEITEHVFSLKGYTFQNYSLPKPIPPVLPDKPVKPRAYARKPFNDEKYLCLLNNNDIHDVTFVVFDKQEGNFKNIYSQQLILSCSPSKVLEDLFTELLNVKYQQQSHQDIDVRCHLKGIHEQNMYRQIFSNIEYSDLDGSITMTLINDITYEEFLPVLEVTYCGWSKTLKRNLRKNSTQEYQEKALSVASLFKMEPLTQMIRNFQNSIEDLFHETANSLTEELTHKINVKFYNNPLNANVQFICHDTIYHAHKAMIYTNGEVFKNMFGVDKFMEGTSKMVQMDLFQGLSISSDENRTKFAKEQERRKVCESFLTYLYTGHARLSNEIVVEMMALSHQYGLQCLTMQCEVFLCEMIDACMSKDRPVSDLKEKQERILDDDDLDLLTLMEVAKWYNAKQLKRCCLYYIGLNYDLYLRHASDDELLKNKIEKHRWPSASYLRKKEEYEHRIKEYERGVKILNEYFSSEEVPSVKKNTASPCEIQ